MVALWEIKTKSVLPRFGGDFTIKKKVVVVLVVRTESRGD